METIEILQHKDGVLTERIRTGEGTAIRKTFEKQESTREITNYLLISRLNVPTLRVLSYTENSITLEDIAASDHWRLGVSEDLSDPMVAAAIARWYKRFHGSGRGVVTEDMYDESDFSPWKISVSSVPSQKHRIASIGMFWKPTSTRFVPFSTTSQKRLPTTISTGPTSPSPKTARKR